ncbi:hypothetical protein VUG52_18530 [Pseudomonas sp. LH21]|uniref:hypothetical protein n=1 Tax=Pseudomonas sp. LH21 TaxID=3114884 RepID=UPI002F95B53D
MPPIWDKMSATFNVQCEFIGMISKVLKSKAPITVVGVIIVGVVCSAIYDAIVKPGFNVASRYLFDFFTFGSQKLRDSVFSNAALDPTPMAGVTLLLYMLAIMGLYVGFMQVWGERIVYRIIGRDKSGEDVWARDREYGEVSARVKIILRGLLFSARLSVLAFIIAAYVAYSSMSQSVLVWRLFHANLNIISPYVNQEQLYLLRADFARMRTEKQYAEIEEKMGVIAKSYGVELRSDSF